MKVHVPRPFPERQRFYKVSKRVLDDISTVAAGFSLSVDPAGAIVEPRLAYGGVAATPIRALDAERILKGRKPSPELRAETLAVLEKTFRPLDDHRGSADYRSRMVSKLFEKFWFETWGDG